MPVWLKVVRLRPVGKERFFKSFQKTPYELITTEKNQENLEHRELDMAVQYIRFISVREELVGKSILNYQSLRIRIIVRNHATGCSSRCRPSPVKNFQCSSRREAAHKLGEKPLIRQAGDRLAYRG